MLFKYNKTKLIIKYEYSTFTANAFQQLQLLKINRTIVVKSIYARNAIKLLSTLRSVATQSMRRRLYVPADYYLEVHTKHT